MQRTFDVVYWGVVYGSQAAVRPSGESGRGAIVTVGGLFGGGFQPGPTAAAFAEIPPERVFIAGRQEPGSKRTQRRLRRSRTGAEGRISHLKRRYGIDRSRLKGNEGQQIWTEWAIHAYNSDTLAVWAR
jgi:NAD(P)-dependent dehydrogenase (short-subunit alcohol dehydrogenase family)